LFRLATLHKSPSQIGLPDELALTHS
jgi:hypothetical protein